MRKGWLILSALIAVAAIPTWYAFAHGYRCKTEYTCVRCRVIKHSDRILWYDAGRIEQTEFSRWYEQHQPAHAHQWGWCGTRLTWYPGGSIARGCGDMHAILWIPPESEREFIESATPLELARFYAGMDSPDPAAQRKAVDGVRQRLMRDTK